MTSEVTVSSSNSTNPFAEDTGKNPFLDNNPFTNEDDFDDTNPFKENKSTNPFDEDEGWFFSSNVVVVARIL